MSGTYHCHSVVCSSSIIMLQSMWSTRITDWNKLSRTSLCTSHIIYPRSADPAEQSIWNTFQLCGTDQSSEAGTRRYISDRSCPWHLYRSPVPITRNDGWNVAMLYKDSFGHSFRIGSQLSFASHASSHPRGGKRIRLLQLVMLDTCDSDIFEGSWYDSSSVLFDVSFLSHRRE